RPEERQGARHRPRSSPRCAEELGLPAESAGDAELIAADVDQEQRGGPRAALLNFWASQAPPQPPLNRQEFRNGSRIRSDAAALPQLRPTLHPECRVSIDWGQFVVAERGKLRRPSRPVRTTNALCCVPTRHAPCQGAAAKSKGE